MYWSRSEFLKQSNNKDDFQNFSPPLSLIHPILNHDMQICAPALN